MLDADLGDAVARLPWLEDGVDSVESSVTLYMARLASADIDVARTMASLPWFSDNITNREYQVILGLARISRTNPRLAESIVGIPQLAESIVGIPWFNQHVKIGGDEALDALTRIARIDPQLVELIVDIPWFRDDLSHFASVERDSLYIEGDIENEALELLTRIAQIDPQLVEIIVRIPWFRDDITIGEYIALHGLTRISSTDIELAKRIISSSGFADGISKVEFEALHDLGEIALRDPELALHLGEYAINGTGNLGLNAISTIFSIIDTEDDSWDRLTEQPWFTDGLDNEELALVAVLDSIISHPQLYNDLIQTSFTRSATVSLPLAREVNLWVFQPQPFHHSQEDVLPMLEDSVQITEEFMEVPFPVTDVILVIPIVGPEVDHGIEGGKHWGSFITVTRYETSPPHDIWLVTDWEAIYHEVAHYYFGFGPPWLVEGGAEFMWMYIREERAGTGDIENQHSGAVLRLQENCYSRGIRSLQQLNELQSSEPDLETTCHYSLGAYFLLSLYETLGEEAVSAALRELYLLFQSEGSASVTEEEIYQAFLRNTPLGLEDEFLALYRQFHTPDFVAEEAEPA